MGHEGTCLKKQGEREERKGKGKEWEERDGEGEKERKEELKEEGRRGEERELAVFFAHNCCLCVYLYGCITVKSTRL